MILFVFEVHNQLWYYIWCYTIEVLDMIVLVRNWRLLMCIPMTSVVYLNFHAQILLSILMTSVMCRNSSMWDEDIIDFERHVLKLMSSGMCWHSWLSCWPLCNLDIDLITCKYSLCPKTIVRFICPARHLRLKVRYFRAKLSSSRSLLTPQLWDAFWSSSCFLFISRVILITTRSMFKGP